MRALTALLVLLYRAVTIYWLSSAAAQQRPAVTTPSLRMTFPLFSLPRYARYSFISMNVLSTLSGPSLKCWLCTTLLSGVTWHVAGIAIHDLAVISSWCNSYSSSLPAGLMSASWHWSDQTTSEHFYYQVKNIFRSHFKLLNEEIQLRHKNLF